MNLRPHLFSLSKNLDSLIAAIAGFLLIQLFCKHSGIGVSPDSVTYISVSRHIYAGNGFTSFDGLPMVDFPVGYPCFLTIISFFTGLDALQFGPVLNGLLFGILIYVSGSLMNGFHHASPWYKRIVLSCIFLSPALQEIYSLLWSETIFLILTLFFIISISAYLREGSWKWILISALICSLACVVRYAGVFLVITGLTIIFFNAEKPWSRRWAHCIFFGLLSISLLTFNIIRNFSITGRSTGARQLNHTSLSNIVEYFGGVLSDWLLLKRSAPMSFFLVLIILTIFIATIYFARRKGTAIYRYEYVIAVSGLVYCLFMLFSSTLTRYEIFTNRLLSPLFIPLLWSMSWWLPGFLSRISYREQWLIGFAVLFLTAWFLKIQLESDYEYYDGVKDAGVPGYQEDPFVYSGIVQFVEKNKTLFDPSLPIYSNAPDALYFISGLTTTGVPNTAFPEEIRQYYKSKNNYLVWFNDIEDTDLLMLDSILTNKNIVVVKQLPDGAVYIIR